MEVAAGAAPAGGDWRSQLHPLARGVMVKSIMKTLKKHLPLSEPEGLRRLQDIAEGFEEKFYTAATNQSNYSRKIAMLLLYVKTANQNPHRRAPGLPPLGRNPSHSSAVPSMSQQQTRDPNASTSEQASSLPSVGQSFTGISQTSALQNMSGQSTIPGMQRMAMQSATQSGFQLNPCVGGQQRHPQPCMHQQPSLQEAQPTQQPNIPSQQQQQHLMGQQPNLHQDQLIWQQSGAVEMQQPQRLLVQPNSLLNPQQTQQMLNQQSMPLQPQHHGPEMETDTADEFELPDPSEEGTSATADPVFSELPMREFGPNEDSVIYSDDERNFQDMILAMEDPRSLLPPEYWKQDEKGKAPMDLNEDMTE